MATDEGFDPLPALTEALDPRDELRIEDAFADPATLAVPDQTPEPLGRAPAYDFVNHRLLPGGAGGPLMIRGAATLGQWVDKCLRTRRGENPAVDPDFGSDLLPEDLLGEGRPFDPSAVAEYIAAAERALRVHPRISDVDDMRITSDPDDDAVMLSFTVIVDDDEIPELTFNRLPIGG
jgi:hypothetical protein